MYDDPIPDDLATGPDRPDPAFEVGAARYLLRSGLSADEVFTALVDEVGAPPGEARAAIYLASAAG